MQHLTRIKALGVKFRAKTKGTFIERSAKYLTNVYRDYKEVVVSVRSDIKAKPLKSSLIFTGLGVFFCALKTNPSEQSFRAKCIECTNEVNLVSGELVNPTIVEHLRYIQRCYNKDLVRYANFGVLSIIWVDKYSDQCNIYENTCSYLQLPYRKVLGRVIDVGFFNVWWVISRKMLDYDVNYL